MRSFAEGNFEETYYNCRCTEVRKKHNLSNHIKTIWIPTYEYGLDNCRDRKSVS